MARQRRHLIHWHPRPVDAHLSETHPGKALQQISINALAAAHQRRQKLDRLMPGYDHEGELAALLDPGVKALLQAMR